jgi:hypothetical protein
MKMKEEIEKIKRLPKFEGSHCPNESNHEYIVRKEDGKYVRIKDVLEIIENRGMHKRD